jgi:hypothetical protein
MESFPLLKHNQVALLRADKNTGIVLDDQLSFALNDSQKVFSVFDSLNDAIVFADDFLSFNQKVEVVIYSDNEEVLFHSNQ